MHENHPLLRDSQDQVPCMDELKIDDFFGAMSNVMDDCDNRVLNQTFF